METMRIYDGIPHNAERRLRRLELARRRSERKRRLIDGAQQAAVYAALCATVFASLEWGLG